VSDAGVHGLLEHLYGCLELCRRRGLKRVFLHAFTDGRDSSPNAGIEYVRQVEAKMKELGVGQVATVSGRYWAMDRDNRWPRVEKAFNAIVNGVGPKFPSAAAAIQSYYEKPTETNMSGDEIHHAVGHRGLQRRPAGECPRRGFGAVLQLPRGPAAEITKAFVMPDFNKDGKQFDRGPLMKDLCYCTMTAYEQGLPVKVAYPKPPKMLNTIGEYLSKLGLKQFRCAETEKFPHVTFFFNDYREEPFPGEDRQIIPRPR